MRQPVVPSTPGPLLLTSDLHLREESLPTCMRVLDGVLEEVELLRARGVQINDVGFLGDWYHLRGLIPVRVQNPVVDFLDRSHSARVRWRILPGNHDQVDVQGRHALEVFRSHPAVLLYEQPVVDQYGLWIPYRPDLEEVRAILRAHPEPRLVFWHGSILGAKMNDTRQSDHGLTPADFAGRELVLLGHYHRRQQYGHCHYVGSPWETRADERGDPKGFALLEMSPLRLTFHDRQWGARHRVLEAESSQEAQQLLAQAGPGDRVRVTVPEAEVEAVSRALAGRFNDLVVTPRRAEVGARALPGQGLTLRQHAERYVAERAGDLDASLLMTTFSQLTD